MRFFISFSGILALLLAPALAIAQRSALPGVVDSIAGTFLTTAIPSTYSCPATTAGNGACQLAALLLYAVERARVLIGVVAFVTVIAAAFNLIIRQSEEALTSARRTITGVIIGLFLIFTSERFVDALYGGFSIQPGTLITGSATSTIGSSTILTGSTILSEEILGIVRWGETLVAIIAVGLLVLQGVAVLASFGSEQALQKAYRAVTSTVLGLLLIVFDRSIAAVFGFDQMAALPGAPDANVFLMEIFGLVRLLLGFTGIVTIAIMIYAGLLMISNLGNDELITKAKSIIGNALIGFLLIAAAFVIVHFVIMGASAI